VLSYSSISSDYINLFQSIEVSFAFIFERFCIQLTI